MKKEPNKTKKQNFHQKRNANMQQNYKHTHKNRYKI